MSGFVEFLTTPEFLTGAFVSGLLGSGATYLSTRASDKRKFAQEDKKTAHEDLKSNRQIIRETATAFSGVCSSVFEKALDNKSVFNTFVDAAATAQGLPDKKAMEKIEFAIDLMDETKRITTAFNNLRVVAPVAVLQKATALNAAMLQLTKATTIPLAKPPLVAEAGKAMDDFTNAVREELGLDPYTAEDAVKANNSYMEALAKQMNDYIKETQQDAKKMGILEPGSVPITTIKAGDLTEEHVGKFVGCNNAQFGFNYGAKILKVIRVEEGDKPGVLLRIAHPPMPGGTPARQERRRLRFDQELQLVELPNLDSQ